MQPGMAQGPGIGSKHLARQRWESEGLLNGRLSPLSPF